MTLEHLESFIDDNSNIFITTQWHQDGHLETYQSNNTPHPRGDSKVWGTLNFKSNAEIEVEKETPCGKVKVKVELNKEKHPENTLHVLI